jgi:hypothetical protein
VKTISSEVRCSPRRCPLSEPNCRGTSCPIKMTYLIQRLPGFERWGVPTRRDVLMGATATAGFGEAPQPQTAVNLPILLNQRAVWVPEAAVREMILVDNHGRLYGFWF